MRRASLCRAFYVTPKQAQPGRPPPNRRSETYFQRTAPLTSTLAMELGDRQSEYEKRSFFLCLDRRISMSTHTLDHRVKRPVWGTERRYGETCNPNSLRFSLLLNRTVFTPRKDPLRPLPVLAVHGSQEASGTSPRKRLIDQVCSRPLKATRLLFSHCES